MIFINFNTGGSFTVRLPNRPDSGSIAVSLYGPNGNQITSNASYSLDSVNTTLTAGIAVGASTGLLASPTGVVAGKSYLVGGPESANGETVTVKSLNGSTINFLDTILIPRSTSDSFFSTDLVVGVSSSQTTAIAKGYRAEITYTVNSASQPVEISSYQVVRYTPETRLTLDIIRSHDPNFGSKKLPSGLHFARLKEVTWQSILRHIASTISPGALVGTVDLTDAHALLLLSKIALNAGPDYQQQEEKLRTLFVEELNRTLAAMTIDNNQDGRTGPNDGYFQTINLIPG